MKKYLKDSKQFMAGTWEQAKGFATEKKNAVVAAGSAAIATGSQLASAAVDVTGVNTAISTAETSAHSIGTTVIGVVAGLAVVGIVIGLVRKL